MEIHVIRHTRLLDRANTCYGQSDVPLADSFQYEVVEIKKQLQPPYDAVYCSPLSRCVVLAHELNIGEIILAPELKEICFGRWETQCWDNIDRNQLEKWCNDFVNVRPPDGENLQDLYSRVANFVTELKSKHYKKILLITHAGVIRCIHALFNDIELNQIFNIPVGFSEIFTYNTPNH